MSFINFSNHPKANWGREQLKEAGKWGEIIDVEFPQISADSTEEDIALIAKQYVRKIMLYSPQIVMCQGEYTLAFKVITLLKEQNIEVVAACSERHVMEETDEAGISHKQSIYRFVKFRRFI